MDVKSKANAIFARSRALSTRYIGKSNQYLQNEAMLKRCTESQRPFFEADRILPYYISLQPIIPRLRDRLLQSYTMASSAETRS